MWMPTALGGGRRMAGIHKLLGKRIACRADQWVMGVLYPQKLQKHVLGFLEHRACRVISKFWLQRSTWTYVCGWNLELRLTLIPRSLQNYLQKAATNLSPHSEVMFSKRPWSQNTFSETTTASSLADGGFDKCTARLRFENLFTLVKIMGLPRIWKSGEKVKKSIAKWNQSLEGPGRGCRSLAGGVLGILTSAHTEQEVTQTLVWDDVVDHQRNWASLKAIRVTPGWHASCE